MGLDTKTLDELKHSFNRLGVRIEKGAKWLDDKSRTEEESKSYLAPFLGLIDAATLTINEIEKRGYAVSSEEMQAGFKDI